MRNVDNVGGYECVGTQEMWEISVSFSQLCCESKHKVKKSDAQL